MKEKKYIYTFSFIFSLIFHALILLLIPYMPQPQIKTEVMPVMKYVNLQRAQTKAELPDPVRKISTPKGIARQHKVIKEEAKPVVENKQVVKAENPEVEQNKVIIAKKDPDITTKNDISSQELFKDKTYISYYKIINEKLRQAIVYPQSFSEGEIAVIFVVSRNGNLENVEIVQDISTNNMFLRQTALEIVKNAAPFPPFPEDLNQAQLTFNIIFCFRERG